MRPHRHACRAHSLTPSSLCCRPAAPSPCLPQVAVVKHWAKQRAVNDSYRGTLSSYCYVLMCIHLLQTRSPPVLPSLQQMPATFRREVGIWKCEFFDQVGGKQWAGRLGGGGAGMHGFVACVAGVAEYVGCWEAAGK